MLRTHHLPSIRRTRRLLVAALLTGGLLAVGSPHAQADTKMPPDLEKQLIASLPPAGPVVSFAGKVAGTNAYLGLVSRGGRVEAYVCDGDKISAWLGGSLTGGALSAANKANDVRLVAKQSGSSLTGTLTLKGKAYKVSTAVVQYPAGLYRAEDVTTAKAAAKAGWIVLADGTSRGAVQVGTVVQAAPNLNTTSLTVDIGAGRASVAVPSDVTPFKKKKDTTVALPSPACIALRKAYDDNMGIHNNIVNGGGTDNFWGNTATQQYQQGIAMGCPNFPNPADPNPAT